MIIFALGLDGLNFLSLGDARKNKIQAVYGELGLLQLLETQLGLHIKENSHFEDLLNYHQALVKAQKDSFFEKSLNVDGIGSAQKLLDERNLLILNGWNQKPCGIKRIDDLAKVENHFKDQTSYVIRLKNTVAALEGRKNISVPKIEVRTNKNSLPKLWQDTFKLLSECKTQIVFPETNLDTIENAEIELISASNFRESSIFLGQAVLALQQQGKSLAIICPDSLKENLVFGLNYSGVSWTSKQTRSSVGAPALSVFLGMLPLLWKDRSPQALLSWLKMPIQPLGWKKSFELANKIQTDEEIGEELAKYEEKDLETIKPEILKLQEYFLGLVLKPSLEENELLNVSVIVEAAEMYRSWLAETGQLAGSTGASAYSQIETFKNKVGNYSEKVVSQNTLAKLVRLAFSSGVIEFSESEFSSRLLIVSDPRHILSSVDELIWFGYNSSDEASLARSFWSPKEIAGLLNCGCSFAKPTDVSSNRVLEWLKVFKLAKRSYLFTFENSSGGEPDYTHPSFDFLGPSAQTKREPWFSNVQKNLKSTSLATKVKFDKEPVRKSRFPQSKWNLPKSLLPSEINWSPSGVNKLLECQMQWHLDSQRCLSEGNDDYLNDEHLALGNAGHKFFELFFNTSYKPNQVFDSKLAKEKATEALAEVQSLKLWSEIDITNHMSKLINSSESFHNFLNKNNLIVLENETSKQKKFDESINLKGKIDIILGQNSEAKLVIDFKSRVSSHLIEQLEAGSVQLSLYLEMIGRHDIAVGYFDLTNGSLHYGGNGQFLNAKRYAIPKTKEITNQTLSEVSQNIVAINSGELLASIEVSEAKLHKPFCQSCNFSGICGKRFEKHVGELA